MKREGRQHGMVRSLRILPSPLNPRPNTRFINKFDSPPTAGLFAKVSSKPTNHSKFTGKCGTPRCNGCHLHPACKSKDKTKGTQKLKSGNLVTNVRLATWRVVDSRPGFNLSGFSATGMLDHLSNDDYLKDEVEMEDEGDEEVDYPMSVNDSYSFADLFDIDDDENGICEGDSVINEYDDIFISEMGFQMEHCQVEEDEDWCFVESCS